MAKTVKADANVDVDYVELVGIVNSMTAKLAEMGTVQENLAAKLTQQGVAQENLATKSIVSEEKGYDIGTSEAWQANMKQMFDEFMGVSMESTKRSRTFADQIMQAGIDLAKFMNTSVVTTMDMVAKQAVRHSDIAIDSQWKPKPKSKDPMDK